MSQLTPFVQHKKLTLPHDGRHVQYSATGSVFIVKEALSPFEMQFDDQGWFAFDQGLGFNLGPDRQFKLLNFRALNFDTDTDIEFYVANAALGDSRLTITQDRNRFQIISTQVAKTLIKAYGPPSINATTTVAFYGIGGIGPTQAGAAYSYRKSIIVTNNSPISNLEISKSPSPGLVLIATVFPLQAWTIETSADIYVVNPTGALIACRICELFYPV